MAGRAGRFLRLALFGDPVEHSLSPVVHRAALAACGIAGDYEAVRVDAGGLVPALARVGADLGGANVTMPHKRAAASACDQLTEDAARLGAVNTVSPGSAGRRGANSDLMAFRRLDPGMEQVLVLGSGGAAAAALVAFEARRPAVSARDPGRAGALLASLGVDGEIVAWGEPRRALVVNATPLGMDGEPLPKSVIEAATGLIDLPYGAVETPAAKAGRARGLPVVDGIEFLVAQAAESFEIWTGEPAPRAAMRAAVASP